MRSFPWKWRLADLPEPPPGAPTVFSTFACGGGSSMGYKRAGFRVLGCVETDPQRAATRARYLVGMSVPPSMAAHLADKIRTMWLPRRDA